MNFQELSQEIARFMSLPADVRDILIQVHSPPADSTAEPDALANGVVKAKGRAAKEQNARWTPEDRNLLRQLIKAAGGDWDPAKADDWASLLGRTKAGVYARYWTLKKKRTLTRMERIKPKVDV